MIESALLKEKYAAQKKLDDQADHDIEQYFRNAHRNAEKLAKEFGFEIRYGAIEGGFLTPVNAQFPTTI